MTFPLAFIMDNQGSDDFMDASIDLQQNSHALLLSKVVQNVNSIEPDELPSLLAQVAALLGTLSAQLLTIQRGIRREPRSDEDSLLTVTEAAQRLNTSPDWLYRHASKLPFTVRLTAKQLRFSSQGIEKYLQRRRGV
jgi:predicted DNA-binding transcriptional regulator AlpA